MEVFLVFLWYYVDKICSATQKFDTRNVAQLNGKKIKLSVVY